MEQCNHIHVHIMYMYIYILYIYQKTLWETGIEECACVYVHHAHHLKVVIKDLQNGLREVYHKMFEDKIVDLCP